MTEHHSASRPMFNFNAYSQAEIQALIETVGVEKPPFPALPCFMLALVAGGSIGFGALYYCIVASDADLSLTVIRVMGGTVFSLGLVIVMIGGAELFTGNNLIVMAWASGKIPTAAVLRNRLIVCCSGRTFRRRVARPNDPTTQTAAVVFPRHFSQCPSSSHRPC